ncbi:MAG: T9SS type A sorting domain-containing protein [Bacteroidetes bacterium]|nr:MAG: T9SS type A sorting domain-containing protein [Bacteroidota bacterium]
MTKRLRISFFPILLSFFSFGQQKYSFMVIHCDPPETNPNIPCGYPGKVNLKKLGGMVNKADSKNAKLTIQFSPAWVDSIIADPIKMDTVRAWRDRGHEIAAHHHHFGHQYWDGYMNDPTYADSTPSGCGNYLGATEDFYNKLRLICGDSLLLTLGQGPNNDPNFLEKEWSTGIIFKTNDRTNQPPPNGGRVTDDAFSSVVKDTMGVFTSCKLSYCFVDDDYMGYDSLRMMLDKMNNPDYNGFDVIGAVTHPFNYSIPMGDTIFNYWIDTITQLLPVIRVRDIMRLENCSGGTLPTSFLLEESNTHLINVYPNPSSEQLFFEVSQSISHGQAYLFNLSGEFIQQIKWDNSFKHKVDISYLPRGSYFLQVPSRNGTINKKIIKK